MRLIPLVSLDVPELDDFSRLTDVALRRRTEPEGGLYLAESTKVIGRALAAGHRPRAVLTRRVWIDELGELLVDFPDVPVYVGDDELMEELTGYHLHRGALASMHRPVLPDPREILAEARRVVILDGLVDHTNVGAIFRSVAGLGADAVLVTPECADPLYRRSVRVSMGTVLQVPWTRLPAWKDAGPILHDAGFSIAALALSDDAVPLDAYRAPERVAMVLGSEGDGLGRKALAQADTVVTIPMLHGVDSLNVAAAAAVALWAIREPKV